VSKRKAAMSLMSRKIELKSYNILSKPACALRSGIAAGVEFIVRLARNCCPIENIRLKLTTKSQIETRLPEPKYSYANSRNFNVQPHLQQYQCYLPFLSRKLF